MTITLSMFLGLVLLICVLVVIVGAWVMLKTDPLLERTLRHEDEDRTRAHDLQLQQISDNRWAAAAMHQRMVMAQEAKTFNSVLGSLPNKRHIELVNGSYKVIATDYNPTPKPVNVVPPTIIPPTNQGGNGFIVYTPDWISSLDVRSIEQGK